MRVKEPLKDWKSWAIAILLLVTVFFYFAYAEVSEDKEELKGELEELNQSYRTLERRYETLNGSYTELNESYSSLEGELEPTIKKIETYEEEITESMEWFKNNSILRSDSEKKRKIQSHLSEDCYKKGTDYCTIWTGCLDLVNSEFIGLEYIRDIEATAKEDKLLSLDKFLENGGGDCEDYSLFYKAEMNHILEECGNVSDIKMRSWISVNDSFEKHSIGRSTDWYYTGASSVNLKKGYTNPNVVCGNMYDPQTGNISGHCVIAFTREKVTSLGELEKLKQAPMIEPQSGKYLGLINNKSSSVFLLSETNYKEINGSYIYSVITDRDMFLFSFTYGEWLGYSSFSEQLKERKDELLRLKYRT